MLPHKRSVFLRPPIAMRIQGAVSLLRGALRAAGEAEANVSNRLAASVLQARRGYADDASLKKTPLHEYHIAHGGECRGRAPLRLSAAISVRGSGRASIGLWPGSDRFEQQELEGLAVGRALAGL